MSYKIVNIFKLLPGRADEEIARCRDEQSVLNLLKSRSGFIAYEVIKLSEDSTMTIQSWQSKAHFGQAIGQVSGSQKEIEVGRQTLAVSRESFGGEVVLAG